MKDRIAVIEDIAEMAQLVRLYLENEGWETVLFESAEAALEGLENDRIDLLILDINLPGMDGFAFLDRYRRTRDTPVLIVSARSADEDIITGLGYGADEFVTKPFSPRVLVARVRAMLRRSKGLGEPSPSEMIFGPFTFDREACLLKKDGERIPIVISRLTNSPQATVVHGYIEKKRLVFTLYGTSESIKPFYLAFKTIGYY